MPCGEYHWPIKLYLPFLPFMIVNRIDTTHLIIINEEISHLTLKMHIASTADNGRTHVLDDPWQFVCADMGMSISQNVGRCAMLAKNLKDAVNVATLLAASVEFSV